MSSLMDIKIDDQVWRKIICMSYPVSLFKPLRKWTHHAWKKISLRLCIQKLRLKSYDGWNESWIVFILYYFEDNAEYNNNPRSFREAVFIIKYEFHSKVIRHLFRRQSLLRWYLQQQRVRVRGMIGFLVRGRVRIKSRISARVGVTFDVRVYRRRKFRTYHFIWSRLPLHNNKGRVK